MLEKLSNAVLIQGATLDDIERLVKRVVDERLREYKPTNKVVATPKETRYIKRKEAAAMLGVSLTSLDKWVNGGLITPCKISSRVYFTEEEIARAMGLDNGIKNNL